MVYSGNSVNACSMWGGAAWSALVDLPDPSGSAAREWTISLRRMGDFRAATDPKIAQIIIPAARISNFFDNRNRFTLGTLLGMRKRRCPFYGQKAAVTKH